MIQFLSSWVKNISLSLIVVSILEMILPNNKTKKYLKTVMGMFILFNIISPFIENSNKFNLEDINFNSYIDTECISKNLDQTSTDKRLKELYIKQLEEDITNKIEQKGYIVDKCKVDAYISNNQEDSGITKIIIKCSKEKNRNNKEESIENKLVLEIEKIQSVKIGNKIEEKIDNISKSDKDIIIEFLMEEYGVRKQCLEIN